MHWAIILLAGALAACDSPTTPSADESCARLTELSCLESTACTLVQDAPSSYTCRSAANACEAGFRQTIDSADDCEAESGCAFDPGECYCPPGLVCICSGGPPPQCVTE